MPIRGKKKRTKHTNNAARERSRVQSLRAAFLTLQRSLPSVPPDTKLSKLDILVMATAYIYHLTQMLDEQHIDDQTQNGTIITSEKDISPIIIDTFGTNTATHAEQKSSMLITAAGAVDHNHNNGDLSKLYSSIASVTSVSQSNENNEYLGVLGSDCSGDYYKPSTSTTKPQVMIDKNHRQSEPRPNVLTNENSSVGILHPVKKWPMRRHLIDEILGRERTQSSQHLWKKQ